MRHRQIAASLAITGVLIGGAIANAQSGSPAHKATPTHRVTHARRVTTPAGRPIALRPVHHCRLDGPVNASGNDSNYAPAL